MDRTAKRPPSALLWGETPTGNSGFRWAPAHPLELANARPLRRRLRTLAVLAVVSWLPACLLAASERPLADGRQFDPGQRMVAPAPGAPEGLKEVSSLRGGWTVTETLFGDEAKTLRSGYAEWSWINRGHALKERLVVSDGASTAEFHQLSLLVLEPTSNRFNLASVSDHKESFQVFDGHFESNELVLRNEERRLGGVGVVYSRLRLSRPKDGGFTLWLEESMDRGAQWEPVLKRDYTRAPEGERFVYREDTGLKAGGLPPEASEFDFLLGELSAAHKLRLPSGQFARFPSVTTAVRTLGGAAIQEFLSYDVDPSLPDAASTVIRVYNRSMRRWECLYLDNRGYTVLFFGGSREGDSLVLHQFEADTSDGLHRFVFHSITEAGYDWYSELSVDRGESFQTNWTIEARRQDALRETPAGD